MKAMCLSIIENDIKRKYSLSYKDGQAAMKNRLPKQSKMADGFLVGFWSTDKI